MKKVRIDLVTEFDNETDETSLVESLKETLVQFVEKEKVRKAKLIWYDKMLDGTEVLVDSEG